MSFRRVRTEDAALAALSALETIRLPDVFEEGKAGFLRIKLDNRLENAGLFLHNFVHQRSYNDKRLYFLEGIEDCESATC